MKMNGQAFTGPNEAYCVLIRNDKDVVFKARAVLDFTQFDALCPKPQPKRVQVPGGAEKILWDDKSYGLAFDHWGTLKTSYIIIMSLAATPELEWETVKLDDPSTWNGYRKELEDAFFTDRDIQRIVGAVWEANGIDNDKLEEARKRFLAGLALEQGKLP